MEERRWSHDEEEHTEPVHTDSARTDTDAVPEPPPALILVRVIHILEAILLVFLAFRFVFALLGANAPNPFVHFIYAVSWPFAYPFVGIFGYTAPTSAVTPRVELYTLVAMAVWALVAWVLVRMASIRRP